MKLDDAIPYRREWDPVHHVWVHAIQGSLQSIRAVAIMQSRAGECTWQDLPCSKLRDVEELGFGVPVHDVRSGDAVEHG